MRLVWAGRCRPVLLQPLGGAQAWGQERLRQQGQLRVQELRVQELRV